MDYDAYALNASSECYSRNEEPKRLGPVAGCHTGGNGFLEEERDGEINEAAGEPYIDYQQVAFQGESRRGRSTGSIQGSNGRLGDSAKSTGQITAEHMFQLRSRIRCALC